MTSTASVDLDALREKAFAVVDEAAPDLRRVSLDIHGTPELNFEEHHAHTVLSAWLEENGFEVRRRAYGLDTAFEAVAGSGPPVIAIFCEYDALPGIGHGCGHNLIAVAGLGAGLALKEALPPGRGTIVLLGSPAEEGGGGKIYLIERGALQRVDAALMVHPAPVDSAYMNVLAIEQLRVEFRGRNAHAAAFPWQGVNALDAMILAFNAIALMRQQILPTDRVHGVITHGGVKPNIIPDYTAAEFYIRSARRAQLDTLREKVLACFEGAARATGCSVDVSNPPGTRPFSDMVTNDVIAGVYIEEMARLGLSIPGKDYLPSAPSASTDMGDVSYVVPSIHPAFAIPASEGNHTPGFAAAAGAEEAHAPTMRAARALAATALRLYLEPGLLEAARSEFIATVKRQGDGPGGSAPPHGA